MSPRGRQQERCLGDRAAALADGELGSDARDGALSHLVNCDTCRDDVAGQRMLKARLRDLSGPPMPAGLMDRLNAMGYPGFDDRDDLRLIPAVAVTATRWHRVSLPPVRRRGAGRSERLARAKAHVRVRRSVRYAMAGGASVLALGVTALAFGGGAPAPTVSPQVDNFTLGHATTTGEIPFGTAPQTVSFRKVLVGAKK